SDLLETRQGPRSGRQRHRRRRNGKAAGIAKPSPFGVRVGAPRLAVFETWVPRLLLSGRPTSAVLRGNEHLAPKSLRLRLPAAGDLRESVRRWLVKYSLPVD